MWTRGTEGRSSKANTSSSSPISLESSQESTGCVSYLIQLLNNQKKFSVNVEYSITIFPIYVNTQMVDSR